MNRTVVGWALLWGFGCCCGSSYSQHWVLCTLDKRHKGSAPDSPLTLQKSQADTFGVSACQCPEITITNFLVMKFLAYSAQAFCFLHEVSKGIMGIQENRQC